MKPKAAKMFIYGGKIKRFNILEEDVHIGLNSGRKFKTQYVFIDIDDMDENEVVSLARRIIEDENFRRILVVKSSDVHNGWHIISFSPVPFKRLIDIQGKYETDGGHLAKTQDNGFATLRVTPKNGFQPKIFSILNNNKTQGKQLNFYDFDMEKVYRKLIGEEQ